MSPENEPGDSEVELVSTKKIFGANDLPDKKQAILHADLPSCKAQILQVVPFYNGKFIATLCVCSVIRIHKADEPNELVVQLQHWDASLLSLFEHDTLLIFEKKTIKLSCVQMGADGKVLKVLHQEPLSTIMTDIIALDNGLGHKSLRNNSTVGLIALADDTGSVTFLKKNKARTGRPFSNHFIWVDVHTEAILCMAGHNSNNMNMLITGSSDGTIKISDWTHSNRDDALRSSLLHDKAVNNVTCTDKYIISTSLAFDIKIWTNDGKNFAIKHHFSNLHQVHFISSLMVVGNMILSADKDGHLVFTHIESEKVKSYTKVIPASNINDMALLPKGRILVGGTSTDKPLGIAKIITPPHAITNIVASQSDIIYSEEISRMLRRKSSTPISNKKKIITEKSAYNFNGDSSDSDDDEDVPVHQTSPNRNQPATRKRLSQQDGSNDGVNSDDNIVSKLNPNAPAPVQRRNSVDSLSSIDNDPPAKHNTANTAGSLHESYSSDSLSSLSTDPPEPEETIITVLDESPHPPISTVQPAAQVIVVEKATNNTVEKGNKSTSKHQYPNRRTRKTSNANNQQPNPNQVNRAQAAPIQRNTARNIPLARAQQQHLNPQNRPQGNGKRGKGQLQQPNPQNRLPLHRRQPHLPDQRRNGQANVHQTHQHQAILPQVNPINHAQRNSLNLPLLHTQAHPRNLAQASRHTPNTHTPQHRNGSIADRQAKAQQAKRTNLVLQKVNRKQLNRHIRPNPPAVPPSAPTVHQSHSLNVPPPFVPTPFVHPLPFLAPQFLHIPPPPPPHQPIDTLAPSEPALPRRNFASNSIGKQSTDTRDYRDKVDGTSDNFRQFGRDELPRGSRYDRNVHDDQRTHRRHSTAELRRSHHTRREDEVADLRSTVLKSGRTSNRDRDYEYEYDRSRRRVSSDRYGNGNRNRNRTTSEYEYRSSFDVRDSSYHRRSVSPSHRDRRRPRSPERERRYSPDRYDRYRYGNRDGKRYRSRSPERYRSKSPEPRSEHRSRSCERRYGHRDDGNGGISNRQQLRSPECSDDFERQMEGKSEVWIPTMHAGAVIGPQGGTIKSLQKKSGAKMWVDNSKVRGDTKLLNISGGHLERRLAEELVAGIINHYIILDSKKKAASNGGSNWAKTPVKQQMEMETKQDRIGHGHSHGYGYRYGNGSTRWMGDGNEHKHAYYVDRTGDGSGNGNRSEYSNDRKEKRIRTG